MNWELTSLRVGATKWPPSKIGKRLFSEKFMLRMYSAKYPRNWVFHRQSFPLWLYISNHYVVDYAHILVEKDCSLLLAWGWYERIWQSKWRNTFILLYKKNIYFGWMGGRASSFQTVHIAPYVCEASILGYFKKCLLILFNCIPTLFWPNI